MDHPTALLIIRHQPLPIAMSTNAKLERTIARFEAKIADGDYYEAHQTIRTIANRYVHTASYTEATELLYHTTSTFIAAKKFHEANDLVQYLIEVYAKSHTPVDLVSKSKLIQLLLGLPASEPFWGGLKKSIMGWSVANGSLKFGDAQLNHILGMKFLEANDFVNAETHLVFGTEASVRPYAEYLAEWALEDASGNYGVYMARAVINYLSIQNIRFVKLAVAIFTEVLATKDKPQLISVDGLTVVEFSDPLTNFLQLLVLVVQAGSKDAYLKLRTRYLADVGRANLKPLLDYLGEVYFQIRAPQAGGGNPFGNILSGLMGN
ncbi:hypothetical protein BABINDRAFT_158936 [Babjeviella inositovora NRRL Y-12698]|uniref:Golgi to ER traffic protein 4 n=1 Tax=Babjeviella inositovora NRRL Y-12698 TaxID=984486 RepID=A0A1E3QZ01_9ASCO|nr:uncharacterized protein BABINDRAFT_158936 [Babjeviella inositovora NRRL Y-12698]ODQ82317.1 hypothetical protein BABINDRAFT_158936 [Babjeviella inositovora NRRL Y-12698]